MLFTFLLLSPKEAQVDMWTALIACAHCNQASHLLLYPSWSHAGQQTDEIFPHLEIFCFYLEHLTHDDCHNVGVVGDLNEVSAA